MSTCNSIDVGGYGEVSQNRAGWSNWLFEIFTRVVFCVACSNGFILIGSLLWRKFLFTSRTIKILLDAMEQLPF